ncbi:CoA transferase [Acidisoma sp. L85]|jgi:2-methylfumaryl-CoA isomerase|uniref:CoA transferase n=1 Tax=Acidisoma sp. L85 TaxID=1641850 RepID=UPI00131DBD1F|nr:CoA transferase [Acidisoma sp. L85]
MTYPLLAGIRVIESSAFIAAPLAGLTLAQYGADVIRFDLIGGGIDYNRLPMMPGGRSLYWTSLNKGKRSVAIDIRKPEGRDLLRALVTAPGPEGGILLTNVPTPWLLHKALVGARPDLISCTIEGNADGSTAVDYTVNCATGYPMLTGDGTRAKPVNHALPAWDLACAYQAAFGLTAAILRRRATGEGSEMRLALSDVAFSAMSHLGVLAEAELLAEERRSIGNDIYGAFGRDFATADGERVMIAAVSARQWRALAETCGIAEAIASIEAALGVDYSREADRYEGRDIIASLVKRWVEARSLAEIASEFDAGGVCWGQYRSVRELIADDARVSTASAIFDEIETSGVGRHRAAGATIRLSDMTRGETQPAPLLGAQTDEVLSEVLGLPQAAIGALHDRGVVAGPEADPLFPQRGEVRSFAN